MRHLKPILIILVLAAITQAATISGRVFDTEGNGIPDVFIRTEGCFKSRGKPTYTDADGYYVVRTVDAPCYLTWVRPEHPDFLVSVPNAAIFLFYPQGHAHFVLESAE